MSRSRHSLAGPLLLCAVATAVLTGCGEQRLLYRLPAQDQDATYRASAREITGVAGVHAVHRVDLPEGASGMEVRCDDDARQVIDQKLTHFNLTSLGAPGN